jgi:NADH-quinone oxidoreductase subunit N
MNFFYFFENQFKLILPELYILFVSLFILMFGAFFCSTKKYNYPVLVKEFNYLILLSIFFSLILIYNNPIQEMVIFNDLFIVNFYTSTIKFILLLTTFCTIAISFNYIKKEGITTYEYNVLLLLSLFGMMCFISSNDLISIYLAIEIQSLAFYILAGYKKNSAFSTEAGLKYFILGAFSSGLILFGISLIYGFTGTTNFEVLSKLLINISDVNIGYLSFIEHNNRLILGIIFLFVGFLFKLAAAPFHMWSPDVYEGAPTSVTALFAIVPKLGLGAVLVKLVFLIFYDLIFVWQNLFLYCGVLSVIIGTFSALYQTKIKRFLAFSSISQMGYILLALSTGTLDGSQSVLFFLILYVVMSINIWSIVLTLEVGGKRIVYLTDLQGLSQNHNYLSFIILINFFSMAGIPPLAGFYAKYFVFYSLIESSFYSVAILCIILTLFSAFYYVKFIKIMFFEKSSNSFVYTQSLDYLKSIVLSLSFLIILFLFIKPNILYVLVQNIIFSLYI